MARLSGIDLPKEKKIEIGLTYIYGVGRSLALEIAKKANVPGERKVKDLTEDEIVRLRNVLSEYPLEGDLRKEVSLNIKRLMEIGSYRGSRHRRNLPCRGQRTKTNARTRRGKRKTVAGKKKVEAKA